MQNAATQADTKRWRGFFAAELAEGQAKLGASFYKTANTAQALKDNCQLVDNLLKQIWQHTNIGKGVCLIAVGGYGRCELFPHSDIDLLILLPTNASAELNAKIESLVGLLWDVGLNVGHSVRNLSECIDEAGKDVTIQTNLLEARLLAGSKALYQQLTSSLDLVMNTQAFFEAKLKEQQQRYAKYNDTAYNLEPNIKESPGSLRDLQTIIWIMKSQKIGDSWSDLVKLGMISALGAKQIRRHQQFLQMLRVRLHLLAKRREDRLLFDYQNELAVQLGLVNTSKKRASEQLMQSYYRSVKFISLMNEILLQTLQHLNQTSPPVIKPINARFEAHNQLLETKNGRLFQLQPSAILESFLLLQQHPELTGMSATLLRNLLRVKKLVNREFRQNIANKKLFIEILSQPNGVNHSLRRMNRYGILGEYIPAFGKIIGQMQHDLFHVYTVDEHILNVLANLRRFSKPELAYEFPLCSKLFTEFDAPYLLYLAALFHDIAKGRGGDHSTLGTLDAKHFCKSHGLPKQDIELVAWLVKTHLTMSSTAQKSDLSDPDVIEGFAKLVGNERRLKALYLLTVADIRATSPTVWNAWKARLLESLFYTTERALNAKAGPNKQGDINSIENEIQIRQAQAISSLDKYGLKQEAYQHLWDSFGNAYFIRFESSEIAWHSRLLTPHLNTPNPIVRARLSPSGDGIEVMIYTRDQNDLFARICNFFDRMGYSIAQAKIYTTEHDYALNTFIVLDQSSKSVSYSGLLKYIEIELTQKLDHKTPLDAPLQGRISRQVKHMPIKVQINMTEDAKSNNHLLEVITNDRPGLLANIARQFLQLEILLHNAKINTLGNRAEDTFVISAKKNEKLSPERIQKLQEALHTDI